MSEEADNQEKSEALKQKEEQAAIMAQEQAIAESEKAIAEANKAKLEAELPAGATATPPEGTITTDDKFGYLAELVAYDTLTHQVEKLVKAVKDTELPKDCKILLVEDLNVAADDVHLLQVERQLETLKNGLAAQIEANKAHLQPSEPKKELVETKGIVETAIATAPVVAVATAGIGAVSNMFRADYTVKGKEISLSDTALRALIAGKLSKCSVYLPHFYNITESKLIDTFEEVVGQRWGLQNQVQQLNQQIVEPKKKKVAELEVEIKKLADPSLVERKQAKLEALTAEQQAAETAVLQSESLITACDESRKALLTAADDQTASPMEAAVLREKILALKVTHLLYATIVSSGGEAITSRRWLTSGHTAYLGGSVVSYILAKVEGDIVTADTLVRAGRLEYQMGSKEVPAFGEK
ncbi:hypothetical protein [Methanococcoides seepicolus]|uniref:Uncharacterized protein n=1 Tax=Methanococcoides seepicolus TaxID=2828780 RepID=A0A9E5DDR0_9EURY|nr:hypothetical protein [Methanococcoides seepicolus]MCM1988003.1 hypothetical protein [Methanococcoides seepicolus]